VLAAAGMIRAGHQEKITEYLCESLFIPAPAQGVLALQVREEDQQLSDMLSLLAHEETQIQVEAERGFLEGIGGSCHQPIGAYCELRENDLVLTGLFGNESGTLLVEKKVTGPVKYARELGLKLAQEILEALEDGR
jgi:hydroxymethylbilane synthase